MRLLTRAMTYYPYVFHPITMIGGGTLLLIRHEWARQDAARSALWRRVGVIFGAGLLALVPTVGYFAVTGASVVESTMGNSWVMDALVGVGFAIAGGTTWYLWRRFAWGELVPGAMVVLLAVTVPYVALSPFWNVSGHVISALLPALYLTLVDRTYWPLLSVPAVMVPNRVFLEAHTWPQVIGGALIAAAVTTGFYWRQNDASLRPHPEVTSLLD